MPTHNKFARLITPIIVSWFLRRRNQATANFLRGAVAVAADLCWFYASDLVRSFRTNLNESKRRGKEENIQRDDNSAGENVARKYAACSVVELAVPSLIMTHILGRTRARPTTACEREFVNKSGVFYGAGAPTSRGRACDLVKNDATEYSLEKVRSRFLAKPHLHSRVVSFNAELWKLSTEL